MNGKYKRRVSSDNSIFIITESDIESNGNIQRNVSRDENDVQLKKRDNWGNDVEFLLACIALSVGLGNIWRFPFVALGNKLSFA